jgi:hypothetical protein
VYTDLPPTGESQGSGLSRGEQIATPRSRGGLRHQTARTVFAPVTFAATIKSPIGKATRFIAILLQLRAKKRVERKIIIRVGAVKTLARAG